MAAEIFIARHGQNEDNKEGLLNGHRDRPLTELGREQARELGRGILAAGIRFDAIYTSPLIRARDTAAIVADIVDPEIVPQVEPGLIERDFGDHSGWKIEDAVTAAGDDVIRTPTVTYMLHFPNGEDFPELLERAKRTLEKIRTKHDSGKVLLVCHGDLGKMLYAAATRKNWKDVLVEFHFGNSELIDISGSGNVKMIELEQYNT